jgi:hypothetical protein
MSNFKLDDLSKTARGGLELALVGDDSLPQVRNNGSILELAKDFGQYAPSLDLFEMNGNLIYYDHRRERQMMTGRVFRGWVENYIYVVGGYNSKTGAPEIGSLNLGNAMDVLVNPAFLRGVRRIEIEETVRLPRISDEGKLELMPEGYDEESGVYTVPGCMEYPMDWDVAQGKEWFNKWFGAMPYADERSKAVMLVGLLCMYIRHLPGGNGLRPGMLWEANMAGSGKSICAKASCSITLGFAPSSKRKKGEELDKEIEAHVRSKSPVIFLDNLYGTLKSATLDQLITSKVQTFRGMGGQTIVTLRNDAPVFATGNDLEKNEDAWRRWLQCILFEAGDPQERKVPFLLDEDVMESEEWRKEALAALWSMLKYWDEKGRPEGETTLGSFEAFSRLVGGIVVACGFDDPIKRPEGEGGMSPEKADFVALAKGLYAEMLAEDLKMKAFGLDDMARVARSLDLFADMIGDEDFGKKQMISQEKLSGEERGAAVDQGHMTQSQLQHWTSFIKGKIGQEPVIDGVKVRFGDRVKEKRRVKFTLQIL